MKFLKKILKVLSILLVVGFIFIPIDFAFATGTDRNLTDREQAAFIVRDEWSTWVKTFTASLSELDKNATARIYDNMDFYDMQYRFTEKYKKVPEYLDEDGKPTQKLKDLIKEKRKKISGAAGVRDYLKFTAIENGATLKYEIFGSLPNIDIGYSLDGSTFIAWPANNTITLNSGESVYIWNKKDTLSTGGSDRIIFRTGANFNVSGNLNSMINFTDVKPYCFFALFAGDDIIDASEMLLPSTTLADSCYAYMYEAATLQVPPELPATTLAQNCYSGMFKDCYDLIRAPRVLPAKKLENSCYMGMFNSCTNIEESPEIMATTLAQDCFTFMFYYCSSLKSIKIAYDGSFDSTYFYRWVRNVPSSGDFYYNGEDSSHGESAIPTGWDAHEFTEPLKFTASQASTIKYRVNGTPDIDIQYSYDNIDWIALPANTDISLSSGQSVYLKNTKNTLSTSEINYVNFIMSGSIAASGDINALINYKNVSSYCYHRLFEDCAALTSTPDLVSKTIAEYCYNNMFKGCTGLREGTDLPAGSLPAHCYESMFQGCTNLSRGITIKATVSVAERSCYYMFGGCQSLIYAPDLYVKTMAPGCYANMFNGCRALQTAPDLPATTLANACYSAMFSGCQNLDTAPIDLPATTLADSCYSAMFSGCIRLKASPEIKAITVAPNCFSNMFASCNNLESIDIMFYTGSFNSTYFDNWVSGVADTGTLYYTGTDTSNYGPSAIPKDSTNMWQIGQRTPLAFTAEQDNSTISYNASSAYYYAPPKLYYSYDNISWTEWLRGTNITLNTGEKIYVRGKNKVFSITGYYTYFTMSGKIAASGSVNSLIRYGELADWCFYRLFYNCSALTSAPELPATTLASHCYEYMFANSGLINTPELPATNLADNCYNSMFYNCSSLQVASELPATTLAHHCYAYMFAYSRLVTGPDIKATTLADGSLFQMFKNCSYINSIKLAYTGNFNSDYFATWVDGVSNTGTFYYSGSDTSNFGESAIPKNSTNQWNVQPYTP